MKDSSEDPRIKQLSKRIRLCRIPGCYCKMDTGVIPRFLCRLRPCPWCHYRRLQELFDTARKVLPAKFSVTKFFVPLVGSDPASIRRQVGLLRKRICQKLQRAKAGPSISFVRILPRVVDAQVEWTLMLGLISNPEVVKDVARWSSDAPSVSDGVNTDRGLAMPLWGLYLFPPGFREVLGDHKMLSWYLAVTSDTMDVCWHQIK